MVAMRSARICSIGICRVFATVSRFERSRSVSIAPGSRLLMVTLCLTVLRAKPATKPVRPDRAPFERPRMSIGAFTALEVMFTMRPKRRAIILSTVARISSIGVSMLASSALIQVSRSHSRKSPGGGPPALLTRMSGSGQAASAALRPVAARISAAVASSAVLPRARMVSSTPSCASARAQPLPSPLLAAQTSAFLPAMPRSILSSLPYPALRAIISDRGGASRGRRRPVGPNASQAMTASSSGERQHQRRRARRRGRLAFRFPFGTDGADRFEVDGDGAAVLVAERRRALYDLGHARADEVELRRLPGLQQRGDIVDAPLADPRLRIGGDVGRLLPVRALRIAGEGLAAFDRAQEISRRVAFLAMHDRLGKIAPAVPLGALALDRRERAWRKEQRPPEHLQETPAEGRLHLMRLVRLRHRRTRLQIGVEVGDVRILHAGEGREREDGKEVMPVIVDALAQRVVELRRAPAADAVLLVRRDVGSIERAEGRRQRPAAGERLTAAFHIGVAASAIGGAEQNLAALKRRLVGCPSRQRRNQQENRGETKGLAHRRRKLRQYAAWRTKRDRRYGSFSR